MKKYVYWVIALYFLFWFIFVWGLVCNGPPNVVINFTNYTHETLYVAVIYDQPNGRDVIGKVEPGSTVFKDLNKGYPHPFKYITVEALDGHGVTVSSQIFYWEDYIFDFDMNISVPWYCETFTLTRGIGHFSFDCPDGYSINDYNVVTKNQYTNEERQFTNVNLSGPTLEELGDPSYLSISIYDPDNEIPVASVELEELVSLHKVNATVEILENSTVTVAGVDGEMTVFSKTPQVEPLRTEIWRQVVFIHNGFAWSISMKSQESWAETDKVAFESVLETFQILE